MGNKAAPATLKFADLPSVRKRAYRDHRGREWEISKIEWINGARWCRARRYGTDGDFSTYRLEIVRRDGGLSALRAMGALAVVLVLAGCAGDDLLDDIEARKWDAAAAKVSAYCETAGSGDLWLQRTRIEARREIRQRGQFGPLGPTTPIEDLDDKTAFGNGPVLMIWCDGETDGQGNYYPVPDEVWRGMVRDWRD